jgi:hypothetical protein
LSFGYNSSQRNSPCFMCFCRCTKAQQHTATGCSIQLLPNSNYCHGDNNAWCSPLTLSTECHPTRLCHHLLHCSLCTCCCRLLPACDLL